MAETIKAPLKGKVALITGASRGIGAGIARVFAKNGCSHIAITYLASKDKAEQVLAGIRKEYPSIKTYAFQADVYDEDGGPKLVEQTLKGLGVDRIDIVVANAAPLDQKNWKPIAELDYDTWRREMTGLVWGPVSLARSAITHMPKGGRIIMISSLSSKASATMAVDSSVLYSLSELLSSGHAAVLGLAQFVLGRQTGDFVFAAGDPFIPYAGGKAAMEAAAKQLAVIYGVKHGVTVNTISVGPTRTEAFHQVEQQFGPNYEEILGNFTLLKRVAEVEEVAHIVAFVASPEAGWITGNAIPANGGAGAMLQG
ncbi:hypothetical protein LTS10_009917 [Elasticomyces elasticus]|nr:hypothetical protein LTS10_009917 [Elasticomyces elasticus]